MGGERETEKERDYEGSASMCTCMEASRCADADVCARVCVIAVLYDDTLCERRATSSDVSLRTITMQKNARTKFVSGRNVWIESRSGMERQRHERRLRVSRGKLWNLRLKNTSPLVTTHTQDRGRRQRCVPTTQNTWSSFLSLSSRYNFR